MNSFLSVLPILVTILALILRVKSFHAAWAGVVTAMVVIVFAFPIPMEHVQSILLRWLPIVVEVLAIIAGGLLLSKMMQAGGAQAELASWIEARTSKGVGAVLLIVHGVTPFMESVTGFGIGVTIGIPLLRHLGLSAKKAVLIGLLGLCAVPWGSMGPGTLIAARMGRVSFYDLGVVSAIISVVPFAVTGIAAAWVSSPVESRARNMLYGFGSGLLLTLAVTGMNLVFGTVPAGALGAVCMILFHLLPGRKQASAALGRNGVRALYAYLVLLAGVLVSGMAVSVLKLPSGWHYIASPALWLFIATLWFARGRPDGACSLQAWQAWRQTAPVTGLFIILGIMMAASGMAVQIARACAGLGLYYTLLTPFVAALGGFVTGSNSGANAMFAATQADIACSLGVNPLWQEAVHNVAAAFLMIASPGKIEMALQLVPDFAVEHKAWVQKVTLLAGLAVLLIMAFGEFVSSFLL